MRKLTPSAPGMGSAHASPAGDYEYDPDDADTGADYGYDDADPDDADDATSEYDADDGEEEEEDEGEEEEAGNRARSLRSVCAACGETNRLRPPKGYEFAQQEGEDSEVKQIRYRCTCGEINRFKVALTRESVAGRALRVFHESYYGARGRARW